MGKVKKPPPTPMIEAIVPTINPINITGYAEIFLPPSTMSWSNLMMGGRLNF